MKIGVNGTRLISEFEGFASRPYNDPAGHCTVGYGKLLHYGGCTPEEFARPPITPDQGRQLLAETVIPYAEAVDRLTRDDITQNQFDALVSLTYNCGAGYYERSQVRAKVNARQDPRPVWQVSAITATDGLVYPGLVRRRDAESRLYHSTLANHVPMEGEDDLKMIVAEWWHKGGTPPHNGWHGPGPGEINLFKDFGPGKAYEIIVVLARDSMGDWEFMHGDFSPAGKIIKGQRTAQVILVPGQYGTAPFNITGRVHVEYLALTGVIT